MVCLQETWITKQQEEELKTMRKGYNAVANSPNDDSLGITLGRKKEGVAFGITNMMNLLFHINMIGW